MRKLLVTAWLLTAAITASAQGAAAHFDMSLNDGKIVEASTGQSYQVKSQLPAVDVKSIDGRALRFDGYSNFVEAGVPSTTFSGEKFSVSVLLAVESYPMMKLDAAEDQPTYATICGNLDEAGKKGFALELSSQGHLRVRYGSASNFVLKVDANDKLDRGEWVRVTATFDMANNAAKLYIDDDEEGSGRMSNKAMVHSAGTFYIGKDATVNTHKDNNSIHLNTFCGLIDDITLYNKVLSEAEIKALGPVTAPLPDFQYPASRYAESLWRPQFHGMPSGGWTNETHGMMYAGGRYHVFFQKNANGPYMSRLHWGHISSENLYEWREEPIAIYPGDEAYDIKGCWSGCIAERGGKPTIFYTAVDNAKARIVMAEAETDPTDVPLEEWDKEGIAIDGRPAGLSDDFRDPYYFTANGKEYLIVGTSKNNLGACTLHEYKNGSWTNDGAIFFQGTLVSQHGMFWEMPNVTKLGDKWLFTCTPTSKGTANGVRTLCWVGTIGADGKFISDGRGLQYLEMGGISHDGFGLLSPTICQHNGKTLMLGIVPDILGIEHNVRMGWAHNYSLPREISLSAEGDLIQKPYSGLTAMRSSIVNSQFSILNSPFTQSLAPVSGRQLELLGEWTVVSGQMGFRFLKQGDRCASLTYDGDTGVLTLDLTQLDRTQNDGGSYKGIYAATLPVKPALGEKLKLNVFLDGSILDIFVCDRWAYSVRLFPTNASQIEAEAFSTAATTATINAWTLDATGSSAGMQTIENSQLITNNAVYDLQGRRVSNNYQLSIVRSALPLGSSKNSQLKRGVYIQNHRKYVAR